MRRRIPAWFAPLLLLAACDGDPVGLDREASAPVALPDLPVTQTTSTGDDGSQPALPLVASLLAEGFTFLSPLPETPTTGEFDPSLLSTLTVEVCVPAECGTRALATYHAAAADGGDAVTLDQQGNHYAVSWRPDDLGLPSPAEYSLRALVDGLVVGVARVSLLTDGSGRKQVHAEQAVAVLENQTLRVRFRVHRNAVIAAWRLAQNDASADDIAAMLRSEFDADAVIAGAILLYVHPDAEEEAVRALRAAGYDITGIAALLAHFGHTAEQAAVILAGGGATAFETGAALQQAYEQTMDEVAGLLAASGYDPDAIFDAMYRVGMEVLGDPADFAASVALAAMKGAGYALSDFATGVRDALQDWSKEQVIDVLGRSDYSLGEILALGREVLGLTADVLMARAESWGMPLDAVVDAMRDAGFTVNEIAAAAQTAYDATLQDLAQALLDAGATAEEIAAVAVQVYEQTLEEAAAALHHIGVTGAALFDAIYRTGTNVLGNPADFALNVTLAVMKGTGIALNEFASALRDHMLDWTDEYLVEQLDLTGFSLGEIADAGVNVLGVTAERMASILKNRGVPIDELGDALAAAGVAVHDVASALVEAGFFVELAGDWLVARLGTSEAALARITETLLRAGGSAERVVPWLFSRTGNAVESTARILRLAGASARFVLDHLIGTLGQTPEAAFRLLAAAGFAAAEAAAAASDAGITSLGTIGEWLALHFDTTAEVTLSILDSLEAPLSAFVYVLAFVYQEPLDSAMSLLSAFGFAIDDVVASWPAS